MWSRATKESMDQANDRVSPPVDPTGDHQPRSIPLLPHRRRLVQHAGDAGCARDRSQVGRAAGADLPRTEAPNRESGDVHRDGHPSGARGVTMATDNEIVKVAGVPRIRIHDLRHTSATL